MSTTTQDPKVAKAVETLDEVIDPAVAAEKAAKAAEKAARKAERKAKRHNARLAITSAVIDTDLRDVGKGFKSFGRFVKDHTPRVKIVHSESQDS